MGAHASPKPSIAFTRGSTINQASALLEMGALWQIIHTNPPVETAGPSCCGVPGLRHGFRALSSFV